MASTRTILLSALLAGAVATSFAASRPGDDAAADRSGAHTGHGRHAHTVGEPVAPRGRTRTYFIAADPVAWNYAPDGRNMITGEPFRSAEDVFVARGPDRIGSTYLKSLYRAYTDASFEHRAPGSPRWRHLGFLGPVIQAEVGDTIVVHFRNNTPFPAGMHPHGVRYAKDSEGALYDDGTDAADKRDDAVPPGRTWTYRWEVPERAGPGPGDPSSVMWMYHGHTDEVGDGYAGLAGPIIVTRHGKARPDGSPDDVDRELVALFEVVDENQSPWLDRSIQRFTRRSRSVTSHGRGRSHESLLADEEFVESNLMHAINGYVYGNGPGFEMRLGERVRWYVMAMGTEVDLHSPHWHGNVVTTSMGMRSDAAALEPGTMVQGDMVADAPGTWLFHCHVNDHILAGMQATFHVDRARPSP